MDANVAAALSTIFRIVDLKFVSESRFRPFPLSSCVPSWFNTSEGFWLNNLVPETGTQLGRNRPFKPLLTIREVWKARHGCIMSIVPIFTKVYVAAIDCVIYKDRIS